MRTFQSLTVCRRQNNTLVDSFFHLFCTSGPSAMQNSTFWATFSINNTYNIYNNSSKIGLKNLRYHQLVLITNHEKPQEQKMYKRQTVTPGGLD